LGILANVKYRIQLAKLKGRIDKDPSPAAIGDLVRYYINAGDIKSAYRLVKKGLQDFPDSEILKGYWNYVRKTKVSEKVRDTLAALEQEPTPEGYITVVNAYRSMKDTDTAADYCRKFLDSFPTSSDAYRLMGELRIERFASDFSAKDGRAAESALQRCLELNEEDQEARRLLARLYYCCGLTKRSRNLVDEILERSPDDEDAKALIEILEEVPEGDEDIDLRFSQIEEQVRFIYDWEEGRSTPDDLDLTEEDVARLMESLAEALQLEGMESATFLNGKSERWGVEQEETEGAWEPFSHYIEGVVQTARKASLRMDIGSFEQGIIEGSEGGAVVRAIKDGAVAFRLGDRRCIPKTYGPLMSLVDELAADCGKSNGKSAEESE
jgi:tetratricopeptide (TPR) repeat protein